MVARKLIRSIFNGFGLTHFLFVYIFVRISKDVPKIWE